MKTMHDVRLALWNAYVRCNQHEPIEGKSSEAYCEACYPNIWNYIAFDDQQPDDQQPMPDDFAKPYLVKVYSYALGPSRMHEFRLAETYREIGSSIWHSPDPIQTAIDTINAWADAYCQETNDECLS